MKNRNNYELFAKNIKQLREANGWRLADMNDAIGIGASTWNGYERGASTPSLDDFITICKFFGVSETEILNGEIQTGKVVKVELDHLSLFAKNTKYLREAMKLKQADMLAACGFKQSTWGGYERGATFPSVGDLITICKFFGVSETDMLHTDFSNGMECKDARIRKLLAAVDDYNTGK